MYIGREDLEICIIMLRQGCSDFKSFGTGNYQEIFDIILDN